MAELTVFQLGEEPRLLRYDLLRGGAPEDFGPYVAQIWTSADGSTALSVSLSGREHMQIVNSNDSGAPLDMAGMDEQPLCSPRMAPRSWRRMMSE